jgi:hypothetical protein
LTKKGPIDFYAIGVFVTFHSQLPDEDVWEMSFAETLETIVPKDYTPPAVKLITDFLQPWIERFRI